MKIGTKFTKKDDNEGEETVADVIATMNEKQLNAMYYIVAEALEGESDNKSEFNNGHHIKAGEYGDPKEVWV